MIDTHYTDHMPRCNKCSERTWVGNCVFIPATGRPHYVHEDCSVKVGA